MSRRQTPLKRHLDHAIRLHRAGNVRGAEAGYRRILRSDPENGDALHLLGLVTFDAGHFEAAAALIAKAIESRGPVPVFCENLAAVLRRLGRPDAAAVCYRQAIAGGAERANLYYELGCALLESSQNAAAAGALEQALRLEPASAEALVQLGNAFHRLSRADDADAAYAHAIALRPDMADAHYNRGVNAMGLGNLAQAAECFEAALDIRPGYGQAHNNLGLVRQELGAADAAERHFREALACDAASIDARYNLARCQQQAGLLDEAEQTYREVLRSHPGYVHAYNNLGNTLRALGRHSEAAHAYEQALSLDPAHPEAVVNQALLNLLRGRFREGWEGYERRRIQRAPGLLHWDGSPLDRRTILLYSEQGAGDTIQFVRYARRVKDLGGVTILECNAILERLMRTADGLDRVNASALPGFDVCVPLLSLPRLFQAGIVPIPGDVPYLHADPRQVREWADVLSAPPSHLRVGISWAGNPNHPNDRYRSIHPSELSVLAGVPRTSFVSLQKGHPSGCEASRLDFLPLGRELTDFADTAALMFNLDLVISVDTAVAHLAGALARPVWTLLPFAPDWRWMLERPDSPWYPTMRLFRQPRRLDWRSVLERVREELRSVA